MVDGMEHGAGATRLDAQGMVASRSAGCRPKRRRILLRLPRDCKLQRGIRLLSVSIHLISIQCIYCSLLNSGRSQQEQPAVRTTAD